MQKEINELRKVAQAGKVVADRALAAEQKRHAVLDPAQIRVEIYDRSQLDVNEAGARVNSWALTDSLLADALMHYEAANRPSHAELSAA